MMLFCGVRCFTPPQGFIIDAHSTAVVHMLKIKTNSLTITSIYMMLRTHTFPHMHKHAFRHAHTQDYCRADKKIVKHFGLGYNVCVDILP